jgi:hypothetical protein
MSKLQTNFLGISVGAAFIAVAAAAISFEAAAAEGLTEQHPNLFVNAQELQSLREKLTTEQWRADLFKQVKADADSGNLVACAVVHALEQDEQYGSKVRTQLVQRAANYLKSKPKNAAYPWGPSAGDAIAFDLVAPFLSANERQTVKTYLRQLALDAIQYHEEHSLTPNMSFVCHWRIGLIGYAIRDPEIIEWAINEPGPQWGRGRPDLAGRIPEDQVSAPMRLRENVER